MAYSKVILNGTTLMDVTQKTVDASNLLSGYTALKNDGTNVTGTYTPQSVNLQSKSVSYTPSETAQSGTVTPDQGYDGLDEVSVSVGAISSTYVGSGITRRSSSDLTASGATVTVPSGYYSAQASKAVASGTAGTPSATKGAVSNHAVSVTPSVTNTTGYITGGTKTGTAVSVSASELVSGTVNITSSGNTDVTNYATASVASGSATASATKGTVSNHSVTVTPSVTRTAGYITAGSSSGTAVSVSASELVSGTKSITENGTGIDVTNYASVNVNVSGGGGLTEYSNGSLIDDGIEIPANLDVYELTDGLMDGSIKAAYLKNFQVFTDGWLDADYVAFSASDTGELWGTIFLDPYVIMILGSEATEVSMRFVGFNYDTQEQYDVACTTGVTTLSLIM